MLYGGKIVVLCGRTKPDQSIIAQHAVLWLPSSGEFIDADGRLSAKESVKRFEKNELALITNIRPIRENDLPDTQRDLELAKKIVKLLK